MKKIILLVIMAFALAGCANWAIQHGYVEKSKAEQAIVDLKQQHQAEMQQAVEAISTQKSVVIVSQDKQLQAIANTLYGATSAFKFYNKPGRIDLIINNRVTEASATTGKTATPEAMDAENKRLAKELDETKTSLADLQKSHEDALSANAKLVDETNQQKSTISKMEQDMHAKEAEFNTQLQALQDKLNASNNKIIAMEKQRADDAEWIRKMKLKIMSILGILSLVCVAGSIWSPVFKGKFAIGIAVFGLAAIAVMYIQPWMILTAVGAVGIGVWIKMSMEHNTASKLNTNLVGAIDEIKSAASGSISSILKDWNGKYTTDASGSVVTVVDKSVEKAITEVKTKLHLI